MLYVKQMKPALANIGFASVTLYWQLNRMYFLQKVSVLFHDWKFNLVIGWIVESYVRIAAHWKLAVQSQLSGTHQMFSSSSKFLVFEALIRKVYQFINIINNV